MHPRSAAFVATLLSNLDPIDALTFTRPPPILGRSGSPRLGLPAAIAPTVVTDAQQRRCNKRARPDASGATTTTTAAAAAAVPGQLRRPAALQGGAPLTVSRDV